MINLKDFLEDKKTTISSFDELFCFIYTYMYLALCFFHYFNLLHEVIIKGLHQNHLARNKSKILLGSLKTNDASFGC